MLADLDGLYFIDHVLYALEVLYILYCRYYEIWTKLPGHIVVCLLSLEPWFTTLYSIHRTNEDNLVHMYECFTPNFYCKKL